VAEQLSRSILPITSGEFLRHIYYGGFFETLSGMTPQPSLPIPDAFRTDFPTTTGLAKMGATTRAAVVCTGPIEWKQSAYMEEWTLLTKNVPSEKLKDCKITLPAPSYQHIRLKPARLTLQTQATASMNSTSKD
jgi:methionine synthase II (cobalamin-independent)